MTGGGDGGGGDGGGDGGGGEGGGAGHSYTRAPPVLDTPLESSMYFPAVANTYPLLLTVTLPPRKSLFAVP